MATSYPGVYVEEFTPAPPIQGVSTSVAGFIGPAPSGPILEPRLVTSWDQFRQVYGNQPLPGFYLWYAVRGFFENEGQRAYIVRVSNASAASMPLYDRVTPPAPPAAVVLKALDVGSGPNTMKVEVKETQALTNLVAFEHAATINTVVGTDITLASADDAAKFRPGDLVSIDSDPAPAPRAKVLTIRNDTVTLSQPLASAATGGTLRLADLRSADGDRVIRFSVNPPNAASYLVPGTILMLDDGGAPNPAVVATVTRESVTLTGPTQFVTYRVTLRAPVPADYSRAVGGAAPNLTATSCEFDLDITRGAIVERYPFLSLDPLSPRYYGTLVNPHSRLISLSPPTQPNPHLPPENLPVAVGPVAPTVLGVDEALDSLLPSDYQNALDALVNVDVNIVAVPDRQDAAVQGFILDHCQGAPPKVGDRFAILDSRIGAPITGPGSVADQIGSVTGNGSGFAALYYPWVLVPPAPPPPGSPPPAVVPPNVLVPPSGHVAGVYARIDNSRGVHKAPAGIEANLQGTIGVESVLGDNEQGLLNLPPYGVNVIRVFRGGQPTVWGARTNAVAAGNTNWQYVNVRRLFLFLEGSITVGIRDFVFDPNTQELWGKLKRSIGAFLTRVWRDGALFGATAKDAFYVRIDDVLNPPDQMALGYLTVEIGVRPSYPAEFIVVRFGIWQGNSSVTEV